ncbi:hypothetical protein [Bacillus massiliigorillae]|uniref:hypothetical protein n=1 Tax=Bacillus massiliigorillae TaxID=1243664 RepID=UPI00039D8B0B|nr:hypothetical protein [Bacillus massiliigorillae]
MTKRYLILFGFLSLAFFPFQSVHAESVSKEEGLYVTTEDIISDIVLPVLDRKVQKEYSDEHIMWNWRGIADLHYNNNHSYDMDVRIEVNPQLVKGKNQYGVENDLVKLRISPSCDSNKINQMVCKHDFKIEILEYKHLSQ